MVNSISYIINFAGQAYQTSALSQRIQNKTPGSKVEVINLTEEDLKGPLNPEKFGMLRKADGESKIFVIDHGMPNSTFSSVHYQMLADFFAKYFDKDKVSDPHRPVRFSFIICHAGLGSEESRTSFAALFHRYLGQVHHIPSEVVARKRIVMINEYTPQHGKLTTSVLGYGLLETLSGWGQSKLFFETLGDVPSYHCYPGSKVVFEWDEKGNQIIRDAYIKKFAMNTDQFLEDLQKIRGSTKLSEKLINDIKEFEKKVGNIIHKPSLNAELIDSLKKDLILLLNLLKSEIPKNHEIYEELIAIKEYAEHSINTNSQTYKEYGINIKDPPVHELLPIHETIKKEIYDPTVNQLKLLPKTELEKPIKKSCTDFLQVIGEVVDRHWKHNLSFEREFAISQYVFMVAATLNQKISAQDKIKSIREITEEIHTTLESEIILSVSISGAIKGMQVAQQYGGLYTLRSFFPLISAYAKEEMRLFEVYKNKIHSISEKIEEYVMKVEKNKDKHYGMLKASMEMEKEMNVELDKILSEIKILSLLNKLMPIEITDDMQNEKNALSDKIKFSKKIIKESDNNVQKIELLIQQTELPELKALYQEFVLEPTKRKLEELRRIVEEPQGPVMPSQPAIPQSSPSLEAPPLASPQDKIPEVLF